MRLMRVVVWIDFFMPLFLHKESKGMEESFSFRITEEWKYERLSVQPL